MSTPNPINLNNLDGRYIKPDDVDTKISTQAATYVQRWKASTSYVAGQQVVSPTGAIAIRKSNGVSGLVYDSSQWAEIGSSKMQLDQTDLALAGWVQPDPLTSSMSASTPDGGGPRFFKQFSAAQKMTSQSFFPIGVWAPTVGSISTVVRHRDTGVNIYVGMFGTDAPTMLGYLAAEGTMMSIADTQSPSTWPSYLTANPTAAGANQVVGWLIYDEVDMINNAETTAVPTVQAQWALLPADDGRFRYSNLGKGVSFNLTDSLTTQLVNMQHVTSVDLYWDTDSNLQGQYEGGRILYTDGGSTSQVALSASQAQLAFNYGITTKRLRRFISAKGERPVWGFVEIGAPSSGNNATVQTAAQIPSAVWHHIIAGATGIIYFNHSFGGPNISSDILNDANYSNIRTAVTALNARIIALAPVLNAPTVSNWLVTGGGQVATRVCLVGGRYYIIAGSAQTASATITFTLPAGVTATYASVIHENRSAIAISGNAFSDTFADQNAVHIYRLDTTPVVIPAATLPTQHFVFDSFGASRTSTNNLGTPAVGPSWTAVSGTWGVDNNGQAYCVSGHNAQALINSASAGASATRSIQVTVGAGVMNLGLKLQASSDGSGGYYGAFNDGSTNFNLYKYGGGLMVSVPSPAVGQVLKISLDSSGLHSIYYDGIFKASFSDTSWSGTWDGMFQNDPDTGRIANFQITS